MKKELLDKQHVIIDLKNQLVETKVFGDELQKIQFLRYRRYLIFKLFSQAMYDQSLLNLQGKVVNIQEESIKLKDELDKKKQVVNHGPKCKRRGRTCDPPPPSVRNFRAELTAKEREIQVLNKQLEETKKTNRKLAKERGSYVAYLSSKEQSAGEHWWVELAVLNFLVLTCDCFQMIFIFVRDYHRRRIVNLIRRISSIR